MITYLYHKRHKLTGLNYFGKTIRDPYTYHGSGVYWNSHLEKHGADIETVQVWEFNNIAECSKFATDFSTINNIVESKDWANLIVENGTTGGFNPSAYTTAARIKKGKKLKGRQFSQDTLTKMSTSKIGLQAGSKNPMYGKRHSDAAKEIQRQKALERKKIVCEHCGTECSPSNHKRWHGEHCRLK